MDISNLQTTYAQPFHSCICCTFGIMCGRFSLAAPREKLERQLGVKVTGTIHKQFNIAPTQHAYLITNEYPEELQRYSWGLIPSWSKSDRKQAALINARSETVISKPSFRMSIRRKRCVVLADSFYEWKRIGRQALPYRIHAVDSSLLLMAGIWDEWNNQDGQAIRSFSILTTDASSDIKQLHDRMPVLLSTLTYKDYLSDIPLADVLTYLKPAPSHTLKTHRVTTRINSVDFEDARAHRVDDSDEPLTLF